MRLKRFRAVNCFGFGRPVPLSLEGPTTIVYLLGRNSSGKTAMLRALASLDPAVKPSEQLRFRNFEPIDGEEPRLEAVFSLEDSSFSETSFLRAARRLFAERGCNLADEAIASDSRVKAAWRAVEEQYCGLIKAVNADSEVSVVRFAEGQFRVNSASSGDGDERLTALDKQLAPLRTGFEYQVRQGPSVQKRKLTLRLAASDLEALICHQLPPVMLFDERYPLIEELPDRLHVAELDEAKVNDVTDALLTHLGREDVERALQSNQPDTKEALRAAINNKLSALAKSVNHLRRAKGQDLLGVEAHFNQGGLQLTFTTHGGTSFHRHLSDDTKMLFAFQIYRAGSLAEGSILLFDEPNTGFHPSAEEALLDSLKAIGRMGNQVVVSTHSEHLIDLSQLPGVRVLSRDKERRLRVRNDYRHGRGTKADLLALQPVLDAIGASYVRPLVAAEQVLLVEGLTDLLYMRGIEKVLGIE
jgi:AAA domain, putative AbiEii toxin, Type IV TA system